MHLVCITKMVKFSQQLVSRPTRTQRIIAQQELLKEQGTFENLKRTAEQIYAQRLSKVQSVEEYEIEYNKLPSELKSFFSTPQELRQQQFGNIQENKTKVQEELSKTNQKLLEINSEYNRKREEAFARNKSTKYLTDLKKDYEEQKVYYSKYQSGLSEGLSQLEQNKNLSFINIKNYASKIGRAERSEAIQKNLALGFQTERLESINKLLSQGYKPQLLQKFNVAGGVEKLEKAEVSFYNPVTRQYAKNKSISLKLQKIEGLQPSKIPKTNLTIPVMLEGKKVNFQVTALLYKSPTGELSTQYGKIGKTEQQVLDEIKQVTEEQIKVKQEELAKKPYYLDIGKEITTKLPYQTRGTEVKGERKEYYPLLPVETKVEHKQSPMEKWYYKTNIPSTVALTKEAIEMVKGGYKQKIQPIEEEFPTQLQLINKAYDQAIAKSTPRKEQLIEERLLAIGKPAMESQMQEEYQTRFERKYYAPILRGETTFEEAEKQFKEGQTSQAISTKYGLEIESRLYKQPMNLKSIELAGYEVFAMGRKVFPRTYGELAVKGGIFYGELKLASLIPPSYLVGGMAGYGGYEIATGLTEKELLPEQRVIKLATGGVSLGLSAYIGYKYAKMPELSFKKVKVPKEKLPPEYNLPESYQRGLLKPMGTNEIIDEFSNLKSIEYYKASQQQIFSIVGRRTIVTTKFRKFLGLEPVYQGIPYEDITGYEKATKLLTKRLGISETEAKSYLQYHQPKVFAVNYKAPNIELEYEGIKQPLIKLTGERIIKQPQILLDESLGIKTRSARTIKEVIQGKGVYLGTKEGKDIYDMDYEIEKQFLTKQGRAYQLLSQAGQTKTYLKQLTAVTEKGGITANIPIGKGAFQQVPFNLYGETGVAQKYLPSYPKNKMLGKPYRFEGEIIMKQGKVPKVTYDLREMTGISATRDWNIPAGEEKQISRVFRQLKTQDQMLLQQQNIQQGSTSKQLEKQLEKETSLKKILSGKLKTILQPALSLKTKLQLISLSGVQQQTSVILKDVLRTATGLGIVSANVLAQKQQLKQVQLSKPRLKEMQLQNINQILQDALAPAQASKLKQAQMSLQVQAQLQTIPPIPQIPQRNFPPELPIIPIPRIKIPNINLEFPFGTERKRRKRKYGGIEKYAYLPDFTARALGLTPETVTSRRANERLMKKLTGLEIRRALKIQ